MQVIDIARELHAPPLDEPHLGRQPLVVLGPVPLLIIGRLIDTGVYLAQLVNYVALAGPPVDGVCYADDILTEAAGTPSDEGV